MTPRSHRYLVVSLLCFLVTFPAESICDDDSFFDSPPVSFDQFIGKSSSQTFNSTGTGAATGDATADTGTIQSDQTSNQKNTAQGTVINSASRGSGQGTNIHVSGGAQVSGQGSRRRVVASQLPAGAPFGSSSQQTADSTGQGAATGDATVDAGSVTSDQTSNQQITQDGTDTNSASIATGHGSNIRLTGASQVSGQGTAAGQTTPVEIILPPGSTNRFLPRPSSAKTFIFPGTGAATGDVSADSGHVQSDQTSHQKITVTVTDIDSASHSSGEGTNIRLSGSAQTRGSGAVSLDTQRAILAQAKTRLTPATTNSGEQDDDSGNVVVGVSTRRVTPRKFRARSTTPESVMSQSDGDAVAIGDGSVSDGTVSSNQDSSLSTNTDGGTSAQGSSVGQGAGRNVKLNGAAQADTSGQQQSTGAITLSDVGTLSGQRQSQSATRGKGGATGEASAVSGSAKSVQSSQVNTDGGGGGTSVHSSSSGSGSGTGIRVSGAASAGGGGGGMQQQQWSNNGGNNNGPFQQWNNGPPNFNGRGVIFGPQRNFVRFPGGPGFGFGMMRGGGGGMLLG